MSLEEVEVIEEVLESEEMTGDTTDKKNLDIDVHVEWVAPTRAEDDILC